MTSLDELIAKAKEAVAHPSTAQVEIEVGGEIVEFEFERLPGRTWADLVATHPPRDGSRVDARLGYNTHAGAEAAAPLSGFRIVDGERQTLSEEQWAALFDTFDGPDLEMLSTAIWGLNVYESWQAAKDAKKASTAKPRRKRS
jgi:hypothetical protein